MNTSEVTTGSIFHVSMRSLKVPGVWGTSEITLMDENLEYGTEKRKCFVPGPKPNFSRPHVYVFTGTEKNGMSEEKQVARQDSSKAKRERVIESKWPRC